MSLRKLAAILGLVLMTTLSGCEDWDTLQVDPDSPTDAPPSSLLTRLLLDMHQNPWGFSARMNQYHVLVEAYYGNQDYLWTTTTLNYGSLRNVKKMDEVAAHAAGGVLEGPNAYRALGKFLRAFYYIDMSRRVGDVPLHEAMKGSEGVFQAPYDTQKEVFRQSLQWLEEANEELAEVGLDPNATPLSGDIRFGGDVRSWQRVVNSFRLRTLVGLSHHADDPDLRVKEQFAAIVNDPDRYPVIGSNAENLRIDWIANESDRYPPYGGGDPSTFQYRNPISATFLDILIETQDPRIFVVAVPTDSAVNSGDPDYVSKVTSFRRADTGALQGDLQIAAAEGKFSSANPSRYWSPTGEPTILLGWPEVEFSIAEGINRGWAAGDAALPYERGIRASMDYYGVDPAQVTAFLAQPVVQYAGNNTQGLEQILTQKYVAFFQNSGWEPFFNQRRTGVPEFRVGPANANDGRIPWRWMYPTEEYQNNRENILEAVERQYGGTDDINSIPWLYRD